MSKDFWNIVFSLFFVALLVLLYIWIAPNLRYDFSVYELFFMVLATFRLTRLFVYDKILKFFREWFGPKGWQGTVSDLLGCPWCVSMWFAPFVLAFYVQFPEVFLFYIVLGLTALASVVQILTNAIGHWGEKCTVEMQCMKKK